MIDDLPIEGFLRLRQILGSKERPGLLPISRSAWFDGVRKGRYPRPHYLFGSRVALYKVTDIRELFDRARPIEGGTNKWIG